MSRGRLGLGLPPDRGQRTLCITFLLLAITVLLLINLLPGFHDDLGYGHGHDGPLSFVEYHGYHSRFSFNAEETSQWVWMSDIADSASLTSLSIPGTHDTMTFDLGDDEVFQCQNTPLSRQLRAGVRYIDIRARVYYRDFGTGVTGDGESELRIYHGDVYTGYTYVDVLLEVFAFLETHPSEMVIMRLKEEGEPINANPTIPVMVRIKGETDQGDTAPEEPRPGYQPPTFEGLFNHYRMVDEETRRGCAEHFFIWPETTPPGTVPGNAAAGLALPTLGALRGKILLLQEFPYVWEGGPYGVPWALASGVLQVEDKWVVDDAAHLEDKWDAIRANLAAAGAAEANRSSEHHGKLFLSHLSASGGVTPIAAAAGPLHNASIAGMNDRTGAWLGEHADPEAERAATASRNTTDEGPPGAEAKTGVVIIDFPGAALLQAVVRRNAWLTGG